MKMFYAKWVEADGRFGFSPVDDGGHRITEAVRDALLVAEAAGRLLAPDADGAPMVIDPPGPTAEQLADSERSWRDQVLLKLSWVRDRHRDQFEIGAQTTLSGEQFKELLVYMQELRDWPQAEAFPASGQRPVMPAWLVSQVEEA